MVDYNNFKTGYFPPFEKWYIVDKNDRDRYLSPLGHTGAVYYYNSKELAEETLERLKKEKEKN